MYIEPQIKNDESTRCQVTPGTDNEDEPKKISPFGEKKNKKRCCILLRALSDGAPFYWLAVNPGLNTMRIGLWDRDN